MGTNYPTSIDSLTNPTSSSTLDNPSHSDQHININDAMEAVQTELGAAPSAGFTSVKTRLDVFATPSASASNTPSTNQNNYSPTGLGVDGILSFTPGASIVITGLVATGIPEGFTCLIVNHSSSFTIGLRHESTASTDVNRIRWPNGVTGTDKTIPIFGTCLLIYAGSRWRALYSG